MKGMVKGETDAFTKKIIQRGFTKFESAVSYADEILAKRLKKDKIELLAIKGADVVARMWKIDGEKIVCFQCEKEFKLDKDTNNCPYCGFSLKDIVYLTLKYRMNEFKIKHRNL